MGPRAISGALFILDRAEAFPIDTEAIEEAMPPQGAGVSFVPWCTVRDVLTDCFWGNPHA